MDRSFASTFKMRSFWWALLFWLIQPGSSLQNYNPDVDHGGLSSHFSDNHPYLNKTSGARNASYDATNNTIGAIRLRIQFHNDSSELKTVQSTNKPVANRRELSVSQTAYEGVQDADTPAEYDDDGNPTGTTTSGLAGRQKGKPSPGQSNGKIESDEEEEDEDHDNSLHGLDADGNEASPEDHDDLFADKDIYTSTHKPSLFKHDDNVAYVNRSSTGVLLIDGAHKSGSCPPIYTIAIGSCLDTCTSDADCPTTWKCCSNGCGRICSSPIQEFGWYEWGQWGSCSASCGGGVKIRNRNCNYPARMEEQAKYCKGNHFQLEPCNTETCDHFVSPWMEWTSWTKCSANCGGGVKSRYRFRVCAETEGDEQLFCDDFQLDLHECNYRNCPDVVYSHWSDWSSCSRSCGVGFSSRFRSCPFCPFTGYVGECSGPNYDHKVCQGPPCAGVQNSLKQWSEPTRCTRDCDKGLRISARHSSECPDEKACDKFEFQNDMCNPQKCPAINGNYGEWSSWSECSADGCEEGYQYSSRDCNHPTPWNHGKYCQGKPFELRVCNLCKLVDGEWSEWEPWTKCSAACGGGFRTSRRSCNNPAPLYGGKHCNGEHFKLEACNTGSCLKQHGYEWGCWSPCSRKCGEGGRVRYATCNAANQDEYEEICNKDPFQIEACNPTPCEGREIEALLSPWTAWSSCSHTCGQGTRIRYKYSKCPVVVGGSAVGIPDGCKGYDFDVESCQARPCSKKALAWKPWSDWSPCTSKCAGGVTLRTRDCNSHGIDQHLLCPGLPYDVQACNTFPCDHFPTDYAAWSQWSMPTPCSGQCSHGYKANSLRFFACGSGDSEKCPRLELRQEECDYRSCYTIDNFVYPAWSEWSACSKTCGGGYATRVRSFSDLMPVNGEQCSRPSFEVRSCSSESCDIDGQWASWSVWSECSDECNGGVRARRRACVNPKPKGTGKYCPGEHFVSEQCNLIPCAKIEPDWSSWTSCSRPCGGGERVRFADCHNIENCCKKPFAVEFCNTQKCPEHSSVAFKMLEWTEWSSCSKTCSCGVRTRYRFPDCSGFQVDLSGDECSGYETDVDKCGSGICPSAADIKELWGEWEEWGSCAVTCGGGIRTRFRKCLEKDAADQCPGSPFMFGTCNTNLCPGADANSQLMTFGAWSDWTPCTALSGHGSRERARFKLFSNDGKTPMPVMEIQNDTCHGLLPAVIPGKYSDWSPWASCTKTCGGGVQHRVRSVIGSSPCDDVSCNGPFTETRPCGEKECIRIKEKPVFGDWSGWSSCSRTCGGGIQIRRQQCMTQYVPEYVFAPDRTVLETVALPPAKPAPRHTCYNGSSAQTNGLDLSGCAFSFCEGELDRYDQSHDPQLALTTAYSVPPQNSVQDPMKGRPSPDQSGAVPYPNNDHLTQPMAPAYPPYQGPVQQPSYPAQNLPPQNPNTPVQPYWPPKLYQQTNVVSDQRPGQIQPTYPVLNAPHLQNAPDNTALPNYPAPRFSNNTSPPNQQNPYELNGPFPSHRVGQSFDPQLAKNDGPGNMMAGEPHPTGPSQEMRQPIEDQNRGGRWFTYQELPQLVRAEKRYEPTYEVNPPNYNALPVKNAVPPPNYVLPPVNSIPQPHEIPYVPRQSYQDSQPSVNVGPPYEMPPTGQDELSNHIVRPANPARPNYQILQFMNRTGQVHQVAPAEPPHPVALPVMIRADHVPQGLFGYQVSPEHQPEYQPGREQIASLNPDQSMIRVNRNISAHPVNYAPPAPSVERPYSPDNSSRMVLMPVPEPLRTNQTDNGIRRPMFQPLTAVGQQAGGVIQTIPAPDTRSLTVTSEVAVTFRKNSHGGWSEWGPWSSCTKDCGGGQRFKIRICTLPSVPGGTYLCEGPDRRVDTCNKFPCRGIPQACNKQCLRDTDCGANAKCCTPDNCNSVCMVGGKGCDFDARSPCSQTVCRTGFECISSTPTDCANPPCTAFPKCVCPLNCPAGHARDPTTGETLCTCALPCEHSNCKAGQRCVPLDSLCQKCPSVGLCLEEGCFLLQLYDKMISSKIPVDCAPTVCQEIALTIALTSVQNMSQKAGGPGPMEYAPQQSYGSAQPPKFLSKLQSPRPLPQYPPRNPSGSSADLPQQSEVLEERMYSRMTQSAPDPVAGYSLEHKQDGENAAALHYQQRKELNFNEYEDA